jgi:branched-chain amino acid transport system permease protein
LQKHNLHIAKWIGCATFALATSLLCRTPYSMSLVNLIAIAALIAGSMRFVMLMGEVSFATAAFAAVGAYGAGVATTLLQWPFAIALLIGPVAVVALSALFGFITLRIKGPYFMLIGFAFAEAVRIGLSKTTIVGGVSGMGGIFPPTALDNWLPAFVVVVVLLLLFILYVAEKSDFGKTLVAIRDNEDLVRTVGLNVLSLKVACFALASFCAGVAGSLQAFVNNVISPADFSFLLAAYGLAYVKIGGESSLFGAVVGAIALVLISSFALVLGAGEQFVYGGAIVMAMLLMPRGLAGAPWHKFLSPRRKEPDSGIHNTAS